MTREDFIQFIETLRTDLLADPGKRSNLSLNDYLEAVARYTQDIQGYYNNTGQQINADEPNWQTFSDILKGASVYE